MSDASDAENDNLDNLDALLDSDSEAVEKPKQRRYTRKDPAEDKRRKPTEGKKEKTQAQKDAWAKCCEKREEANRNTASAVGRGRRASGEDKNNNKRSECGVLVQFFTR